MVEKKRDPVKNVKNIVFSSWYSLLNPIASVWTHELPKSEYVREKLGFYKSYESFNKIANSVRSETYESVELQKFK